jgi:hypothetical protein
MEQAMSMLMTGGAVSPETIRFTKAELPESAEVSTAQAEEHVL